jgi:anti-sigma B factor antagonist
VWLEGDQDIATVFTLADTLAAVISVDDADVVVDLSGVTFMDASTISVLVRARRAVSQSRRLTLRSPSKCAQRLLDLCGLADLLDLHVVPAAPMTGPTRGLGSWVAVPATTRQDQPTDNSTIRERTADLADRAGP